MNDREPQTHFVNRTPERHRPVNASCGKTMTDGCDWTQYPEHVTCGGCKATHRYKRAMEEKKS